jgi:hypothetical protein
MEWQGDDLFEEDFDVVSAVLNSPPAPAVVEDEDEADVEEDIDAPPPLPTRAELIDHRDRIVLSEENFEGNILSSVRADGWKYIRANEGNPRNLKTEELYDVVADSGEQKNLAGKNGKKQTELSEVLRDQLEQSMTMKVESQEADISLEDCERMRALGYIEGDCSEITGGGPVQTGASPE